MVDPEGPVTDAEDISMTKLAVGTAEAPLGTDPKRCRGWVIFVSSDTAVGVAEGPVVGKPDIVTEPSVVSLS